MRYGLGEGRRRDIGLLLQGFHIIMILLKWDFSANDFVAGFNG